MTASTRSRFERWSGGMPLSVPVAFGDHLLGIHSGDRGNCRTHRCRNHSVFVAPKLVP